MSVIAVVGAIYFVLARPDRAVNHHLHDELETSTAERHTGLVPRPGAAGSGRRFCPTHL
jgi:hypothetical protein